MKRINLTAQIGESIRIELKTIGDEFVVVSRERTVHRGRYFDDAFKVFHLLIKARIREDR